MTEDKEVNKKKKTLSLKLGSKPMIAPKKNIEAGKTVIVEKKRYKRGPILENEQSKTNAKLKSTVEKKSVSIEKNINENRSGVVLKPLSKDEQKRILKADTKKEKKDEIEKIRSGNTSSLSNQGNKPRLARLPNVLQAQYERVRPFLAGDCYHLKNDLKDVFLPANFQQHPDRGIF